MCNIFNPHDWEELGAKRVCRKCGKQERWASGLHYEYGGWTSPINTTTCKECGGIGKVFNEKYQKINCPSCNGSGRE